jgi:hypothetical protein
VDDFGTGLRAHLGLDAARPELAADREAPCAPPVARPVEDEVGEPVDARLDGLASLEAELHERERALDGREALLASRAGALLAAAQALYDEVLGAAPTRDDELALLREQRSVA